MKRKMKRRVPRNLPEAVLQCHLEDAYEIARWNAKVEVVLEVLVAMNEMNTNNKEESYALVCSFLKEDGFTDEDIDNAICFYRNRDNCCLLIAEFIGRDICYAVEIDNTQDTADLLKKYLLSKTGCRVIYRVINGFCDYYDNFHYTKVNSEVEFVEKVLKLIEECAVKESIE